MRSRWLPPTSKPGGKAWGQDLSGGRAAILLSPRPDSGYFPGRLKFLRVSANLNVKLEVCAEIAYHSNVSVAASITIGSYILPDIVIAFSSSHPEAIISTHVSNSPAACEAVRTGECDFGLMTTEGDISDNLVVELLWNEPLVLVAAPTNPPGRKTSYRSRIGTHAFHYRAKVDCPAASEDKAFSDHGIERQNIVLELSHTESIKRAVRSDVGLSFLFQSALKDELAAGLLQRIMMFLTTAIISSAGARVSARSDLYCPSASTDRACSCAWCFNSN